MPPLHRLIADLFHEMVLSPEGRSIVEPLSWPLSSPDQHAHALCALLQRIGAPVDLLDVSVTHGAGTVEPAAVQGLTRSYLRVEGQPMACGWIPTYDAQAYETCYAISLADAIARTHADLAQDVTERPWDHQLTLRASSLIAHEPSLRAAHHALAVPMAAIAQHLLSQATPAAGPLAVRVRL